MAYFNAIFYLSGGQNAEIETNSFAELHQIGISTKSVFLIWHNLLTKLAERSCMRDYLVVVELCETHPSPAHKRLLHASRVFLEGVACLSLARDTKQSKWRSKGEQAVADMKKFALMCPFNYNAKYQLLRAEQLYLDGHLDAAEVFYKGSITTAKKQNFIQDEAVCYELYGMFLVENKKMDAGLDQLRLALEKYEEWGAMRKVDDLQLFVGNVEQACYWNSRCAKEKCR